MTPLKGGRHQGCSYSGGSPSKRVSPRTDRKPALGQNSGQTFSEEAATVNVWS